MQPRGATRSPRLMTIVLFCSIALVGLAPASAFAGHCKRNSPVNSCGYCVNEAGCGGGSGTSYCWAVRSSACNSAPPAAPLSLSQAPPGDTGRFHLGRVSLSNPSYFASVRAEPAYPQGRIVATLPHGSELAIHGERCSTDGYRWARVAFVQDGNEGSGWVVRYNVAPAIPESAKCCGGRFFIAGFGCCAPGDARCDPFDVQAPAVAHAQPDAQDEDNGAFAADRRRVWREHDRAAAQSRANRESERGLNEYQRAWLTCGMQYLGEKLCSEMLADKFGTLLGHTSCAAAVNYGTSGKLDPIGLAITVFGALVADDPQASLAADLAGFTWCVSQYN